MIEIKLSQWASKCTCRTKFYKIVIILRELFTSAGCILQKKLHSENSKINYSFPVEKCQMKQSLLIYLDDLLMLSSVFKDCRFKICRPDEGHSCDRKRSRIKFSSYEIATSLCQIWLVNLHSFRVCQMMILFCIFNFMHLFLIFNFYCALMLSLLANFSYKDALTQLWFASM